MAGRVVLSQLESLQHCVRRLEEKRPVQLEELLTNWDLQDILAINLTSAVQLCVDISAHMLSETGKEVPDTMAETFDALRQAGLLPDDLAKRMKAAVGFRNVAVHSYREIDWAIVYHVCHHQLDDFRAFARLHQE